MEQIRSCLKGEELADLVCEYFACKTGGEDLWGWFTLPNDTDFKEVCNYYESI